MIDSVRGLQTTPVMRPVLRPAPLPQAEAAPADQVMLTAQRLAASVPVESSFGPIVESEPAPVEKLESPADPFREKARQVVAKAGEQISQTAWGSLFVELEPLVVESTALSLFERSLGANPQAPSQVELGQHTGIFELKGMPVSDRAKGLARQGEYLSFLGATSAAGPLSPALMAIVQDFDTQKLQQLSNHPLATMLAASTSSQGMAHEGVQIGGVRTERERQNVTEALSYIKERCPQALEACQAVVLDSVPLPEGEKTVTRGLVFAGSPTAVLRRSVTDTPESTQWVLFHEIGHLVDHKGGYTQRPDSPFGRGDSVTPYVESTDPMEDFAETHADVLKNWDKIKSNPDVFLHASGDTGAKRAWILREVYGQELPPPSEGCRKFLELDRGEGPLFDSMPVLKSPGPEFQKFRQLVVYGLQNEAAGKDTQSSTDRAALDWARSYLSPAAG
ncbi:MAG: hypothetical protein J0I12_05250 [Candidatus Eremiobacteraeota bacterium]|nr:hypothetical protein [Candidatus Eremiobacteraeota bacterium]